MSTFSMKPYIVLVDDNAVYLETAKALLETELVGFTVFMANNPIDAIATRNTLDGPAIFLVDYEMPDMDGIRLARYLKSSSRFPVFCYLVTGYDNHQILTESMGSGILYFSKNPPLGGNPFNLGDLYKNHVLYAVEELKKMNTKDGLTGLGTTAEAFGVWEHDFARAKRDATPSSLIFVDMDYLKRTNDTEGHLVGDAALQEIAKALQKSVRSSFDCIFRNSTRADEFGILMPNTNRREARKVLERVKEHLSGLEVMGKSGKVKVRASVGVATIKASELGSDHEAAFDLLMDRADKSMYKDKELNKKMMGENQQ